MPIRNYEFEHFVLNFMGDVAVWDDATGYSDSNKIMKYLEAWNNPYQKIHPILTYDTGDSTITIDRTRQIEFIQKYRRGW